MKERVLEKAKELNYRPSNYAVNLKKGRCYTIAVVVPMINRNFFSEAINGIEEVAQKSGYDVIIYQSNELYASEARIINSLSFGKVDGVIASATNEKNDYKHYQDMVDYGMPLVFFDRILPNIDTGSVRIDDIKGSYIATEHFIKQGLKKIYHLTGSDNIVIWEDRKKGYIKAMQDYNIDFKESWIYQKTTTSEMDGYKFMKRLIDGGDLPEAVNFAGDFAALGGIKALKEHNLRVPEDVAISGFACEPFCSILSTPLTSVDQFSNEMGKEAARILIDKINDNKYRKVVIDPELIVRESSLKNKK